MEAGQESNTAEGVLDLPLKKKRKTVKKVGDRGRLIMIRSE